MSTLWRAINPAGWLSREMVGHHLKTADCKRVENNCFAFYKKEEHSLVSFLSPPVLAHFHFLFLLSSSGIWWLPALYQEPKTSGPSQWVNMGSSKGKWPLIHQNKRELSIRTILDGTPGLNAHSHRQTEIGGHEQAANWKQPLVKNSHEHFKYPSHP